MRRLFMLAALASVGFWPGAVRANDTMAHFAAGELVFTQTDAVSMVSEDLFLSMDEVRVTYRFRNLTSQDVTGLVAFPMPEVRVSMSDADYPNGPESNPMRFSVSVDGQPVPVRFDAKAVVDGRDVTGILRDLNIPIPPYSEGVDLALKKLDRETLARLEQESLLLSSDDEIIPNWALAGSYHWQQTFPAGRDTIIQHRYKPSVGATVLDLGSMARAKSAEEMSLVGENSCMDGDFIKGAKKWAARQLKSGGGSQRILDYILVTGANWAGPIGTFTLTVDKGRTDNLVSFCGEGVKKIAPTQFQMVKKNFTPKRNISVLILDTGL